MASPNSLVLSTQIPQVKRLPDLARSLFNLIGEDPNREGLLRTPERFAKAMIELTKGYSQSEGDVIGEGIFKSESNGPVSVRDIEFFSLCEHHLLPFWGKASIAYLPADRILGLSKLARIVDMYGRRLQVQERLTAEIGGCIKQAINARAVIVSVEAQHMCMMMRGVGKVQSSTKTEFAWRSDDVDSSEFNRLLAQIERNR